MVVFARIWSTRRDVAPGGVSVRGHLGRSGGQVLSGVLLVWVASVSRCFAGRRPTTGCSARLVAAASLLFAAVTSVRARS